MPDFDVSLDKTSLASTVESIKRERAKMMRTCGPQALLILHRSVDIQHTQPDCDCICDPVVITQNDPRPSVEFAREILYPTVH